jgi:hypothetical protein
MKTRYPITVVLGETEAVKLMDLLYAKRVGVLTVYLYKRDDFYVVKSGTPLDPELISAMSLELVRTRHPKLEIVK